MAFCSNSNEKITATRTEIDNIFLISFMPGAPDNAVKVYLWGQYLCNNPGAGNEIDDFSAHLGLGNDEVMECFRFWQEQGLVQILQTIPLEIKYMPLSGIISANKKYSKSKYASFNKELQSLFDRMITPNEFSEFYAFMDSANFEQDAMIALAQYCRTQKGDNVGYNYILTIAKNWSKEGIFSLDEVTNKIENIELKSKDMKEVMAAFKSTRKATVEEYDLYNKWINELGFDASELLKIIKYLRKSTLKLDFYKLDNKLTRYFSLGISNCEQIENFESEEQLRRNIALGTCKNLGIYYENLSPVIETYVIKWLEMGYEEDLLYEISKYCFKNGIRNLVGLDQQIAKLFSLGVVSMQALSEYLCSLNDLDEEIKVILAQLGLSRKVISSDRDFYKIWKNKWGFSGDAISVAARFASGKFNPFNYINKILSNLLEKGLKEATDCEAYLSKTSARNKQEPSKITKHEITHENASALFDSLKEVEI